MIKSILRLLAASASFIALLLSSNSAIAATTTDYPINRVETPIVNLNVISPNLQLIGNNSDSLLDHLGCSCGICTQRGNAAQSQNL